MSLIYEISDSTTESAAIVTPGTLGTMAVIVEMAVTSTIWSYMEPEYYGNQITLPQDTFGTSMEYSLAIVLCQVQVDWLPA